MLDLDDGINAFSGAKMSSHCYDLNEMEFNALNVHKVLRFML